MITESERRDSIHTWFDLKPSWTEMQCTMHHRPHHKQNTWPASLPTRELGLVETKRSPFFFFIHPVVQARRNQLGIDCCHFSVVLWFALYMTAVTPNTQALEAMKILPKLWERNAACVWGRKALPAADLMVAGSCILVRWLVIRGKAKSET